MRQRHSGSPIQEVALPAYRPVAAYRRETAAAQQRCSGRPREKQRREEEGWQEGIQNVPIGIRNAREGRGVVRAGMAVVNAIGWCVGGKRERENPP